jgi:5-methyltetrahydrofolate--homocysteine methyltransferase
MYNDLVKAIVDLETEKAREEVKKLVEAGADPFEIIQQGVMQGVEIVGDKFQKGEYFLPDLLLTAQTVDACSSILKPLLTGDKSRSMGTIVVGTVAGDIHDLGKNIVISTLESGGFRVVDVGVDVPIEKFVEAVRREKADILGMSALLSVTMVEMGKVIKALRAEPELAHVKVMVGGAPLDEQYARSIGADAYGRDARDALIKARELAA